MIGSGSYEPHPFAVKTTKPHASDIMPHVGHIPLEGGEEYGLSPNH